VPHSRQSYFGPYFVDEKGATPPLVGESRVISEHLRKLQEAREEQGAWTQREEVRGRESAGGQRARRGQAGRKATAKASSIWFAG
jgi:hypothetical protein